MTAPQIMNFTQKKIFIDVLNWECERLLNDIFFLLGRIDLEDSERRISLWLNAPRGTVDDLYFENKDEALQYFKVKTEDEINDAFMKMYPEKLYWFNIQTGHNSICKELKCGNFVIGIMKPLLEENTENMKTVSEVAFNPLIFLQWVYQGVKKAIALIEKGQYAQYLNKNLPYQYRDGVVLRSRYWAFVPEDKEKMIGKLSAEDKEQFFKIYETEGDSIPEQRIGEMSFNKYFQMAAYGYEAMNLPLKGSLQENVERYGGEFSEGLLEGVDLNSQEAFLDFLDGKGSRDGRVWVVWKGDSRSRVMLYPYKDNNGFYFLISGNPNWSCYELVKSFLALREHNIHVKLYEMDKVVSYLKEEDYVGIVSIDSRLVHCGWRFPNHSVKDFRYYDAQVKGLLEAIEWQPIEDYRLKKGIISFKKLFKMLIDIEMKKKDLADEAGISQTTIAKLKKDGVSVSDEVIIKICAALGCSMNDIMEIVN